MSRVLLTESTISAFQRARGDAFATDLAMADQTCDVIRKGEFTGTRAFQYTQTPSTVYVDVPCVVRPVASRRQFTATPYADRLQGRLMTLIEIAISYDVRMDDQVAVHGGQTYEVIGPPYQKGPQSPRLIVPCAVATPLATNP